MENSELIVYLDACRPWLTNAKKRGGGFVSAFADAVLRADLDNLRILVPALTKLREKYPNYD